MNRSFDYAGSGQVLTDERSSVENWTYTINEDGRMSAATLNGVTRRLGDFELGPVSVQVDAGDRIGITGPNGAGKTTLLRLLLGESSPDAGTASLGASVAVGVIDQARTTLDDDRRLGDAFEAAVRFARCEGIIPAPEPAHAIRAVFDEAEAAKQAGEERVILFNLCGHGHFDMSAYEAYLAGELTDLELPQSELDEALEHLPEAPALT